MFKPYIGRNKITTLRLENYKSPGENCVQAEILKTKGYDGSVKKLAEYGQSRNVQMVGTCLWYVQFTRMAIIKIVTTTVEYSW